MNVTFTTQQRNAVAQGLMIFAGAFAFLSFAAATGSIPSGFTVQAEALLAFAQGILGA